MPDQNSIEKTRHSTMLLVLYGAAIAAGAAGFANLILYFQVYAWQMIFMVVVEIITILGLFYARKLVIKNRVESAGILTLVLVFLGFGAGELVHEGVTLFLGAGGALVLILVGIIFFPRRLYIWILFPVFYVVYFWLVNQFEPLPRYDIQDLLTFRIFTFLIVGIAVALAVWLFLRVLRFGTIRARLLTVIITMALIPMVLIITLATVMNVQRSIQQSQYQLGSIGDLKISQVEDWYSSLETNILLAIPTVDQVGFTEMLLRESQESELEFYNVIYEREKNRYQQVLEQSKVFKEIFLVDLNGEVIISTDRNHEGRVEYGYNYYEMGLKGGGITVPFNYPYTGEVSILVVEPIYDTSGEQIAMLAAQANLASLDVIMLERAGLGEEGITYLVANNTLELLSESTMGQGEYGDTVYSYGISRAAEYGASGENRYENPWNVYVIGAYRGLTERGMSLLSEQPQAEALAPVYDYIVINIILTLGIMILAVLIALLMAGRITKPIVNLATTAKRISGGELDLIAAVEQSDEIGSLATAFNQMTSQLRKTLSSLEAQVEERTASLEQRTIYLQSSAEVSRAVASVLDPDQLIREVVELIRERFDLYYVGLFLLDSQNQFAVLRAGTGSAGQAMLARQHRIQVGSGMIGWCISNRKSRITQHAELDASRLANPDLPDTRAEAAIPLISRGEVIGALTIQSVYEDAFDLATISVFETMADQVAVALDNARLFVQSQQALESLREVYGEITLEGWRKLLDENPDYGYRSESGNRISPEVEWTPELITTYAKGIPEHGKTGNGNHRGEAESQMGGQDTYYLGIPLKVRDRVIGVLGCYKPLHRGDWSEDEVSFMQDIGQTISVALESARFFNETQLRAENERLIAEVTAQLRQTLDVDSVLTTAAREIQRILDLAEVEIRMSGELEAKGS